MNDTACFIYPNSSSSDIDGVLLFKHLFNAIQLRQNILVNLATAEHEHRYGGGGRADSRPPTKRLKVSNEYIVLEVDGSARYIGASRIEVFLDASGEKSTTFDKVLAPYIAAQLFPKQHDGIQCVKENLLKWVTEQAKSANNRKWENYKFGTYSLIISFGILPGQERHIDITAPSVQFAFMVSDNSESTHYHIPDSSITTVQDVRRVFTQMMGGGSHPGLDAFLLDLEEGVAHHPTQYFSRLLKQFGNLLEAHDANSRMISCRLSRGVGLALPGGFVHRAPATKIAKEIRAVLFMTGAPQEETEYDPNIQYTPHGWLWQLLVDLLETKVLKKGPGRLFALQRLADFVTKAEFRKDVPNYLRCDTLEEARLTDFVKHFAENEAATIISDDQYIRDIEANWDEWLPVMDKKSENLLRAHFECFQEQQAKLPLAERVHKQGRQIGKESIQLKCGLCGEHIEDGRISVTPKMLPFVTWILDGSRKEDLTADCFRAPESFWDAFWCLDRQRKDVVGAPVGTLKESTSRFLKLVHNLTLPLSRDVGYQ